MCDDEGVLGEDEAWEIALNDHPEYRQLWEDDKLPEELVDENGEVMSPHIHLTMHSMIERQIAKDEPRGVAAIARQLEELGVSRHDIRHEMGRPLAEQMWHMLKEQHAFDEGWYLAELRKVVESFR